MEGQGQNSEVKQKKATKKTKNTLSFVAIFIYQLCANAFFFVCLWFSCRVVLSI